MMADDVTDQQRVAGEDRPDIAVTGDVGGAEHADHAGGTAHRFEIQRIQSGVRDLAHADGQMQRAGGQWQVIHITRRAADMALGAFMLT